MDSIWTEHAYKTGFPSLDHHIKTDVLIIGGGITGLLCAYQLAQAGVRYVLLEADEICGGITQNTTAKITAQHGLCYHKLLTRFGLERAQMYLQANLQALEDCRRLSQKFPCHFEQKDSFVYSLNNSRKLEREISALKRLGAPAELTQTASLPFPTAGAVRFPKQAQFHPLEFCCQIARGLHIFERSPTRELIGCTAVTDHGKISAERIIVTTHFPFLNKHGLYFLKLYQHRSYCLALEHAPDVKGMYVDESGKGLSLRNYENLLILGGGAHRTGKNGGGWAELSGAAARYYPQATIRRQWATQDCMSLDGVPYIGQYSKNTPNLYVASGFNKWGMTSAMASATILSQLVQGKDAPYAPVFSPSRSMLHPQLFINGFEAAVHLLTPKPRRCPHMGCALKWNRAERSWDCPCHGSRFSPEGSVIDNPATGDLKNCEPPE